MRSIEVEGDNATLTYTIAISPKETDKVVLVWWAVLDLNQWPPVCKTGALTAELTAPKNGTPGEI